MKIVFATHNQNKLNEVQALLPNTIELLSLNDIGCTEEILETSNTLEGNAKIKANYITKIYGFDCFADDTGLEVEALGGEPGVYSARYAGEPASAAANMEKLLLSLKGKEDRHAQFRTIIVLNLNGKQSLFEGVCKGSILPKKHGHKGFGYDPVFQPEGYSISFAEMKMDEKGRISHRGHAIKKLAAFLKNL